MFHVLLKLHLSLGVLFDSPMRVCKTPLQHCAYETTVSPISHLGKDCVMWSGFLVDVMSLKSCETFLSQGCRTWWAQPHSDGERKVEAPCMHRMPKSTRAPTVVGRKA